MSNRPNIYLTLEIGAGEIGAGGADAAKAALIAAFDCAPIASLLIKPRDGEKLDAGAAKVLIGLAQKRGVAAFIADDAALARMLKADGLHLSWSKETAKHFSEARADLGDHVMIGADCGRSRDDAMLLGEAGADYVAFGIPARVGDRATAEERQRDLISWWAEIFEIPCVACDVASPEQARALADSGADFITVAITSAMTPDEVRAYVLEYAGAMAHDEAAV